MAQLVVYWIEEGQLPGRIGERIYHRMVHDLHERGKKVVTHDDEHAMKSRWVRQALHHELDATREAWMGKR